MSAFANPIILGQGPAVMLERIPLSTNDSAFAEKWLQEALFANPHCLPILEIDPRVGTLIPVAMEVDTGAGFADVLYVTEAGQLVILETKLWRNPEARREVVCQILDYAKQFTSWTYTDLAKEASRASNQSPNPNYLLDCVRKVKPDFDQSAFVDAVNNSFKSGDFILLIVGDGIRTGTEALVGFLEQYGSLRFSFGLIEVAAYKLPSNETLLQPRILAKTTLLQRTILVNPDGKVVELDQIASAEDSEDKNSALRSWYQEFWQEYLNILKLDDVDQPIPPKPAKSTNIYFSMPLKANNAWISAYVAQGSKVGGVYLTFSKSYERGQEVYARLFQDRENIEKSLGFPLVWENDGQKVFISVPKTSFSDLNDPQERSRVQKFLAEMSNHMINVFRHRLEKLSNED